MPPERPRSKRVPSYRRHKASGKAVVTLDGRDHYLGAHGSDESLERYDALIAEWLENGRRLPVANAATPFPVNELIVLYVDHAEGYYVKNGKQTSEVYCIKAALRFLQPLYGREPAAQFGPLRLKGVRRKMVDAGLSRKTCNAYVDEIKAMFKWAASCEFVDAALHLSLCTVAGLQAGRTDARETEPIKPVPAAFVDAVKDYLPLQLWAMIRLQELTAMRPGEVCIVRGCDLHTAGPVWSYVPASHKTEHHERGREVQLGPQAQAILRPFLKPDLGAYLFSPRDVVADRNADRVADGKTPVPVRNPGAKYSTASYRRAIHRAIDRANTARDDAAAEIPKWSPNRLRHNGLTKARQVGGIETAQVVGGHASANTTEVYAERDRQLAVAFALKHG